MVLVLVLSGILFVLAILVGVRRATLTVMLMRPSCDHFFGWMQDVLHQSKGPGAAINLLVIALFIIALIHAPRAFLSPVPVAWGVFLVTALASLIHGPNPGDGTRLLATLITYATVVSLPFAIVRNRDTAVQCLSTVLLSSLVPSVVGMVELAIVPDILRGEARGQSTFAHPNMFGYFILLIIVVILFLTRSTLGRLTRMRCWMLYAYIVLLIILLMFTKARAAWIAMAIVLSGYALFIDRRWFVFIILVPFALLIPAIADRVSDLYTGNVDMGYETLNSLAWRRVLWDNTLQWMADNPPGLLGHGLDLYQSYLPQFFSRGAYQEGIGAHNTLLQIYFEMGAVGLFGFLAIFFVLLTQLLRGLGRARDGTILMALLCASYVVASYTDNVLDYLQYQWSFWFVLGTVLAWMRLWSTAPVPGEIRTANRSENYRVAAHPARGWPPPNR